MTDGLDLRKRDFNPDWRPAEDFLYTPPLTVRALSSIQFALSLLDFVHGLDVSDWRPGVNIKTAKQEGNRFIIPKATQGNYLKAETFPYYRDETLAKGLGLAAFHYWDASIDPLEQARYLYGYVGDSLNLVPVWDIEKYGNQGILSPSVAATRLDAGLQETEQLFGRPVMIYTNRDSWQVLTNSSSIIAKYLLWVASWTTASSPLLPIGAVAWKIWQYTNAYRLPDYSSGLDGNRFNGNEADFEKWMQELNGTTPPLPGDHEHPELQEQIDLLTTRIDALAGDQKITKELVEKIEADLAGLASRHSQDFNYLKGALDGLNSRLIIEEKKMSDISTAAAGTKN